MPPDTHSAYNAFDAQLAHVTSSPFILLHFTFYSEETLQVDMRSLVILYQCSLLEMSDTRGYEITLDSMSSQNMTNTQIMLW